MRVRVFFLVPFSIVVAAVAIRAVDPVPLQTLRGKTFDLYQQIRPRTYTPSPVVVIDIDDESLRRIGQWPWPRVVIANMIERLKAGGAASITLDMVFAEPDRTSPARVLALWPAIAETEALRKAAASGRLPDHDDVLARAIARNKVVTGFALTTTPGETPLSKAGIATLGANPLRAVMRSAGALASLKKIQKAAAGNGALTMIPDADGVLRRVPLMLGVGDRIYPTLAAEALRVAEGASTYVARAASPGRLAGLVIGRHTVPTDATGHIRLYDTGPMAARIRPAWRILGKEPSGVDFTGAIVFIGSGAIGIEDVQHTPLSTATLGAAVHAQAVEQILARDFIFRPHWADALELMAATLIGVVLILVLSRVSTIIGSALVAVSVAAVVAVCWVAYSEAGLLLAPAFTVTTIVALYLSATIIAYRSSENERRRVRAAFGQYLSPALVEQLAANPKLLSLGGDMREVTVLFCDIRGFTAMSETLDAAELTSLVNRFLTAMTEAILECGGTIDKYIGDCVMAFWNAPLDDAAHARHAVDAALSMRVRLGHLNDDLRAEAGAASRPGAIEMGVGINTGTCCVGNMGSAQRFNYSALGDAVNLAARLEAESKTFGVDIVIGEGTLNQTPGFDACELGQITVRGRTQPVTAFTLADDVSATPDRRDI